MHRRRRGHRDGRRNALTAAAFIFLGAWFIAQSFVFLALFVMLAAPLRRWQPQARMRRLLNGVGGMLFAALAVRLASAGKP